jgi:hypothetical protein
MKSELILGLKIKRERAVILHDRARFCAQLSDQIGGVPVHVTDKPWRVPQVDKQL